MTSSIKYKVILVDADGVLIKPPELFSRAHAIANSFDPDQIEPFFDGEFRQATVGKADLIELIGKHRKLWRWEGEPAELLRIWFEHENKIDQALLASLQQLRQRGVLVYLATDQEKYRAAYMREVMFPGTLEGIFVSCEIGYEKRRPQFFEAVLTELQSKLPNLDAQEIIFFDDSQAKVDSAIRAGLRAELYTGTEQIKRLLE